MASLLLSQFTNGASDVELDGCRITHRTHVFAKLAPSRNRNAPERIEQHGLSSANIIHIALREPGEPHDSVGDDRTVRMQARGGE